jgi:hypothetical protein
MATLNEIMDYFGMTKTEFSKQWKKLNEEEKHFFKKEVSLLRK